MHNIIPFDFNSHAVRVINRDGEPWFVAKDLTDVLGYSNSSDAIARHCKGVVKHDIPTVGGTQSLTIIPERDLYRLIIRSKLPAAERFEEWIVGEVLPSIRKTGSYSSELPKMSPADEMIFNLAVNTLNPDPASKMIMLKIFGETRGMHMEFLPDYSKSEGTHHSLTELLKEHGSPMSARKANSILLGLGLLEVRTRQSKSKGTKEFKVVSELGLKYGCNLVNSNNLNETQAHWFDKSFDELLELMDPPVQLSA